MVSDATSMAATETAGEVMAAIDEAGSESRYIIADIAREEAWVSASMDATCGLEAWR
ncbi:MAG: hypothetical protein ABEJ60_07890 [Halodesulfurarchaeum sp.]